jgi:arginase
MRVELIAVPYDSGWRGKRMGAGPEYLLSGGIINDLQRAGANVGVQVVEVPADCWITEAYSAFYLARAVASRVRAAIAEGAFPLVLSGNCGPAALGAVAALTTEPRVFWFDAHADFNTPETTASGFLDGMALATLTGRCWTALAATIPGFTIVPDRSVVLVGARDVDPLELVQLKESGISWIPVAEVQTRLAGAVAVDAERTSGGTAYLHIDLDVLDPAEGRANEYAAPHGLSMAQLEWAIRAIGQAMPIAAAAITAYDPTADEDRTMPANVRRVLATLLTSAARQTSA